jgi:hypothetical protein
VDGLDIADRNVLIARTRRAIETLLAAGRPEGAGEETGERAIPR